MSNPVKAHNCSEVLDFLCPKKTTANELTKAAAANASPGGYLSVNGTYLVMYDQKDTQLATESTEEHGNIS